MRPTSKRPMVADGVLRAAARAGTRTRPWARPGPPPIARPVPAARSGARPRATTRSARTSSGPAGVTARTPATRPASSISSVASARISSWKVGIMLRACAARKSRKSHCGISAMNWQRVGRCVKSAIVTGKSPNWAARRVTSWCGSRKKLLQDPELVHQLERGRVDRVAAKVAQEVRVLLQHQHRHPGPGQEQAQHHAGGPAARDAAPDRPRRGGHGAPMLRFPGPGARNTGRTGAIWVRILE